MPSIVLTDTFTARQGRAHMLESWKTICRVEAARDGRSLKRRYRRLKSAAPSPPLKAVRPVQVASASTFDESLRHTGVAGIAHSSADAPVFDGRQNFGISRAPAVDRCRLP